jgi:hypothetical protein
MNDEHDDDEANRWHLEALVGGDTRWRRHIEQGIRVLGVQWDKLPLEVRRRWWRETGYNRLPPSPEFAARMPELLAAEQPKLENKKREIVADSAHAHELLSRARRPPCEQCLRPASPCKLRCLRSMLHEFSDDQKTPAEEQIQ